MTDSTGDRVSAAGSEVLEHSAALRKELGLFDLVLAQILIVVVADYMGTAVKAGAAHVFFITIALLIVSPLLNRWRGTLVGYHPLSLVVPPVKLFSLRFSKMTFGALTGFEYVAELAGECKNPKRDLPRSVLLTTPVIALIYILATCAILAFVKPSAEDVVAPVVPALSLGAKAFGIPGIIVPTSVVFLLIYNLATLCIFFGVSTRLPMVAGWDHLVPAWFSRLHPPYNTPVNSILFLGAATLAVRLGASIGVGHEEAFQLLLSWSFTSYGLAYLVLFAIPLFSPKGRGLRPGIWLRLRHCRDFW